MQVVRCTRRFMSTSSLRSSPATHPRHDHAHAPVPPRISDAGGSDPTAARALWGAATHSASVGSSTLRQIVPGCSPTKCSVLSFNRIALRRGGGGSDDAPETVACPEHSLQWEAPHAALGSADGTRWGAGRGPGALPL